MKKGLAFIFALAVASTSLIAPNTFASEIKKKEGERVEGVYVRDEKGSLKKVSEQELENMSKPTPFNGGRFKPQREVCDPHHTYDASRTSNFSLAIMGTVGFNHTDRDMQHTSSIKKTVKVGTEVSGTVEGSAEWNALGGKVGAKVSAGSKLVNEVTIERSDAVTFPIPPKRRGWVDYGTIKETWSGYLYYVTPSCGIQNKKYVKVYLPRRDAYNARTGSL